jgi:hypothetical protein
MASSALSPDGSQMTPEMLAAIAEQAIALFVNE